MEVCVCDNGSFDGTGALVRRDRARLGDRLVYRRIERGDGVAGSLPPATAMATGRYCWLLASGDRPAPGAVRAVLELLDAHPAACGLQLGARSVTPDAAGAGDLMPAEALPAERTTTAFDTAERIASVLGATQLRLSTSIVRRDLWESVIRDDPGLFERHPLFPHSYVMGRMAQHEPLWIWCPRPLVESRTGPLYLEEEEHAGDTARERGLVTRELDRLWAELHGRWSSTYRALIYRAYRWLAHRDVVYALKTTPDPGRLDDLRLLTSARTFWWLREFRRTSLRWLVLPRAAYRPGRRWRRALGGGSPLAPTAVRTAVTVASLPAFTVGFQELVPCSVTNRGPEPLSSRLPHPVRLAARWYDETGAGAAEGPRTPLLPSLASGERRALEVRVDPPPVPGEYELRIAPVQEDVAWFDELDPANGWVGRVAVTAPDAPVWIARPRT